MGNCHLEKKGRKRVTGDNHLRAKRAPPSLSKGLSYSEFMVNMTARQIRKESQGEGDRHFHTANGTTANSFTLTNIKSIAIFSFVP